MDDTIEQLERLARLRAGGALTQAEYEAEKAAILAAPSPMPPAALKPSAAPGQAPDPARVGSKSRRRWPIVIAVVIVVLILAAAAFAFWWMEVRPREAFGDAGAYRPPAAVSTTPAPASISVVAPPAGLTVAPDTKTAATPVDNGDSDADEAADDEAYYAAAAPFMRIPVQVAWDGHDYCCLTMGMVYERLQPNQLEFKREGADHIDLTSTDLSVRPWRLITYAFVKHAGDWRLDEVIDSGGPNFDAHSTVSPDQAMVEQFKLTEQPGTTTSSASEAARPDAHPVYSATYNSCMATGDAAEGTTPGILACNDAERDRQDTVLNRTYAAVMNGLGVSQKARLRASERAWLTTREATCRAEMAPVAGGSMARITYSQCMLDETIKRTSWLERKAR